MRRRRIVQAPMGPTRAEMDIQTQCPALQEVRIVQDPAELPLCSQRYCLLLFFQLTRKNSWIRVCSFDSPVFEMKRTLFFIKFLLVLRSSHLNVLGLKWQLVILTVFIKKMVIVTWAVYEKLIEKHEYLFHDKEQHLCIKVLIQFN